MTGQPRTLHINYFALLREQRGLAEEDIVTAASTAGDLYAELGAQFGFNLPPDKISVAINEKFCPLDQPLKDGDVVVFIPPIAGG